MPIDNPITNALRAHDLTKPAVSFLYGYRKTYLREIAAEEVFLFEKTLHWEESRSVYQDMIDSGLLTGTRRNSYLLPDEPLLLGKMRDYRNRLLNKARTQAERANVEKCLQARVDGQDIFDILPCSIMLLDPLGQTTGLLMEPMRPGLGEDEYDQTVRRMDPSTIPHHLEFLEGTYDIEMNERLTMRYVNLFNKRWAVSRDMDW